MTTEQPIPRLYNVYIKAGTYITVLAADEAMAHEVAVDGFTSQIRNGDLDSEITIEQTDEYDPADWSEPDYDAFTITSREAGEEAGQ